MNPKELLQYKIPQNVGIEDKIVGPFSLRQLIILAIGGGISYTLYAITARIYELNFIEYILIAMPTIFALALAMLKIHNVSFGKYIILMMEFAIKPKKRIWDHRGISALVAPDLTEKSAVAQKGATEEKVRKNVNLGDLSAMLDSGGFEHVEQVKHEDIDEVTDDDLITEAYFGHKKQESTTQNMYWRTRDVQKKKLDLLARVKPSAKPMITPPEVAIKTPVQPATAPQDTPVTNKTEATLIPAEVPKKRRRRRRKKPKIQTEPIRPNTQVNSTSKSEPVKLIQKPEIKEGETSFTDLSQGGEIEINLD
ncbi:PrgI family protein [Patescibacteria group bacterium]|nr:PrgI family protein [Patescibacteria group bacterium]MBU1015529.1 PrgI family protein [Patescibacteria group bacterium]MBU1685647.1 PrgI family protein [Patescibacteria group bacterium]MBU1938140.1 PrgI family protein [Patescibacteria group bacterium]